MQRETTKVVSELTEKILQGDLIAVVTPEIVGGGYQELSNLFDFLTTILIPFLILVAGVFIGTRVGLNSTLDDISQIRDFTSLNSLLLQSVGPR